MKYLPQDRKRRGESHDDESDGITYDKLGRMRYHPDFHPNHGKPFTADELVYICKYHDIDEPRAMSFAVGKTEHTIATKLTRLRQNGLYEKYRSMSNERWLKHIQERGIERE